MKKVTLWVRYSPPLLPSKGSYRATLSVSLSVMTDSLCGFCRTAVWGGLPALAGSDPDDNVASGGS